ILDLKTAQRFAMADNPSIQATEVRIQQAKERISQARAAYWPRLDATASASRVWMPDNEYQDNLYSARIFDPGATIDDPQDYYQAGLTTTWLLFDGFERRYRNRQALNAKDQTISASDDARRLLLSSVSLSFLSAKLAQENIDIASTEEAFFLDLLEDAKNKRHIGTGSLSDELNFQIQTNAAIADRIQAQGAYRTALHSLAALLGLADASLPPHVELEPLEEASPEEMQVPDTEQMIAYALEHRPEILQGQLEIQNASLEKKIANSNYAPTINLTASVKGEREEDTRFEGDDFGSTIGLNMTFNLFSGGLYRAQSREAMQKEIEARKLLEAQKINITTEIRTTSTNVITFQTQLRLQQSITRLSQENRDLVEKEYKAGQASLVRLNESQRELTSAQNRTALALVALRQSWWALMSETGMITEDEAFNYFSNTH
ncbi:TolC family protein, partial [Desulfobacterales bacterium]|nr:TolC family protein [Desulfobacterales bacterium]